MITALILLIILSCALLALRRMIRKKKDGQCLSCDQICSACPFGLPQKTDGVE